MEYTTKEAADLLGISVPALRYYEKAGLTPVIDRNDADHRVYTEKDIEWIYMIICMREADLPIREIRKYVNLLLQGSETMPERFKIVQEYKKNVEAKITAMQNALLFLDAKAEFYHQILSSGQEIPCKNFSEEWDHFKQAQKGQAI